MALRLVPVVLLLGLLAGCSAPSPATPESTAPAQASSAPAFGVQRSEGEFTLVASRNDPAGTQSDFFREGDETVMVHAGSATVIVNVTVTGGVPGQQWSFCLSPGDAHDGVCATGAGSFSYEVARERIVQSPGSWHPSFTVAQLAPAPAGAGVAQSIAWTADVVPSA